MDSMEDLAAWLEEHGYHFQEGEIGLKITGSAMNPDPDFHTRGKMVANVVKDAGVIRASAAEVMV